MSLQLPMDDDRLAGLLFVTSERAYATFGLADIEKLNASPGGNLVVIGDGYSSVYSAVKAFHDQVVAPEAVTGVVILGNYEDVPSRAMQVISGADLKDQKKWNSNFEFDPDKWRVWNDDLYASFRNGKTADIPVSRIPIVPAAVIGDGGPASSSGTPACFGIRSADFGFTDTTFPGVLADGANGKLVSAPGTPVLPAVTEWTTDGPSLDRLYFMLHSDSARKSPYSAIEYDGTGGMIALALEMLDPAWQFPGVAFTGACWGALVAAKASVFAVDAKVRPRGNADTIALSIVDRGARSVVGFSGMHYAPRGIDAPYSFGALLHRYFWHFLVVGKLPPAQALHRARFLYFTSLASRDLDRLAKAIVSKTYWSAMCLGFGW